MDVVVRRLNQVPVRPDGQTETFFPFEVVVTMPADVYVRDLQMTSPKVPIIGTNEIRQTPTIARKTFYVSVSTPVTITVTIADGTAEKFDRQIDITDSDQFLYDARRSGPKPVVRKVATKK